MQDRRSSTRCLRAFVHPLRTHTAHCAHCAHSQIHEARGLGDHQLCSKSLISIFTHTARWKPLSSSKQWLLPLLEEATADASRLLSLVFISRRECDHMRGSGYPPATKVKSLSSTAMAQHWNLRERSVTGRSARPRLLI